MATVDPLSTADLRPRVQARLDRWLTGSTDALLAVDPDCGELAAAIRDLLSSGKRLRAGFSYWGWRGAGRGDEETIVTAAAAIELVQAAALLHDDLIDGSDTRRGLPAAHRRLEYDHRTRGWSGDPQRFGEAGAVLAGDLCLAASARLLHEATAGLPSDRRNAGLAVYDTMTAELMAGQYLDILVGVRPPEADPVAAARRVIRYKTVNYTVAKPLQLGGALAGASPATLAAYAAYAEPVGEAFQLRDDLLGVFGDPEQTGKPAGDDLREGKQTVLVALARHNADPGQWSLLARVGDPSLTAAEVDDLRTVLRETGAEQQVEEMIARLAEQGAAAIRSEAVDTDAVEALTALVASATRRTT